MAVLTVQFKVGVPRTEAIVRAARHDRRQPRLGLAGARRRRADHQAASGIDDVPVVTLTLWSDDPAQGAYELERVAHAIEVELKRVPGTREVQTLGGPGRARARAARRRPHERARRLRARRAQRAAALQRGAALGRAGARQPRDRGRDRQLPRDRRPTCARSWWAPSSRRPVYLRRRRRRRRRARAAGALRLDRHRSGRGAKGLARGRAPGGHAAGHQEAGRERGRGRRSA